MDLLQLAEATATDWLGLAAFVTAIGGVIGTILQSMGKKKEAQKVKEVTDHGAAVLKGIDQAEKGDYAMLSSQLAEAGVDVNPDQLEAVAKAATTHVRHHVKETRMALGVPDYVEDHVRKATSKLSSAELRKRL